MIWQSSLDTVWECQVERLSDYRGKLTVRHRGHPEPILTEEVGLAFGAVYGPDMSDVANWQAKAVAAVDGQA